MTYQQIIKQTQTLSREEQQQLAYYILFSSLEKKKRNNILELFRFESDNSNFSVINKEKKQKIKLGLWKNKIGFIASDFNEPLEELSDYM